jgi:hypothetical protein
MALIELAKSGWVESVQALIRSLLAGLDPSAPGNVSRRPMAVTIEAAWEPSASTVPGLSAAFREKSLIDLIQRGWSGQ